MFLNKQYGLGPRPFHLERQLITRCFSLAFNHSSLEDFLVNLHVLGVEGKFHLGEFVCVDDEVGGFCGEVRVLVFVVDFDVDLALDLVGVDDFDPLLDSVRLFGHNQSVKVKLVFVFKLCGLVHDFFVLLEHLQIPESRLFFEDHLVVCSDK